MNFDKICTTVYIWYIDAIPKRIVEIGIFNKDIESVN